MGPRQWLVYQGVERHMQKNNTLKPHNTQYIYFVSASAYDSCD